MSARATLASKALAYGLSSVVSAASALAAVAVFSRVFPAREFGQFAVMLAGGLTLNVLLFGWLRLASYRHLIGSSEPGRLSQSILTIYVSIALPVLGGAALLWLVSARTSWFAAIGMIAVSRAWYELNLETLRAQQRSAYYFATVTGRGLLWIALGIVAARSGGNAMHLGLAYSCASILATVPFIRYWWTARIAVPNPRTPGELFSYGAPLAVVLVCGMAVVHSGRFFLGAFATEEQAGAFAIASDVSLQLLSLVAAGVSLALDNRANIAYAEGGRRAAEIEIMQGSTILFALVIPAAVGAFALRARIAVLVTGTAFRADVEFYMALILPAAMLWVFREYGVIRVFAIAKKTRLVILPSVLGAVTTCILSVLLTPIWRGWAAIGFGIGVAVTLILLLQRSRALLSIAIHLRFCLAVPVACGVMTLILLMCPTALATTPTLSLLLHVTIGCAAYGGTLLLVAGPTAIRQLLFRKMTIDAV